jgi:hypothetical protein
MTGPDESERAARRAAAVRAYCSYICPPEAVPEAVDAAFAALEESDPDAILREATRVAAAERAATPSGESSRSVSSGLRRRIADATGISACEVMPRLLAARASGTLSAREGERMGRHLRHCSACQAAELRLVEAEHAFDVQREATAASKPAAAPPLEPALSSERPQIEGETVGHPGTAVATDPVLERSSLAATDGSGPPASARIRGASRDSGRVLKHVSIDWRRVARGRDPVLAVAFILLLGSFGIAAALSLSDDTAEEGPPPEARVGTTDDSEPRRGGRSLPEPESVTVSVLNGAEVDFLASDTADALEDKGFEIVVVADAERPAQQTVVLRADGTRREAQAVARRLGVSRIRSPETERGADRAAAAGGADVVVVTGSDREP